MLGMSIRCNWENRSSKERQPILNEGAKREACPAVENPEFWNYSLELRVLPYLPQEYGVLESSIEHREFELEIRFFRVSRWVRDFNPLNQKQTNAQVWLRLYDLLMEYRGVANLWNIARSAGRPLRIDPLSLRKIGSYSRVLVNVDCLLDLPERVLAQRKFDGFEFYALLYYEFVTFYCHVRGTLGHKQENCTRREQLRQTEGNNADTSKNQDTQATILVPQRTRTRRGTKMLRAVRQIPIQQTRQ